MHFAVLQFPASNCDQDCVHAVRVLGHTAGLVWHKDTSLGAADAVIVPGGFSYGDYLRCGAIARFSPVMQAVRAFAADHYNRDGWDFVVECYDDPTLRQLIGHARTVRGAIRKVYRDVIRMDAVRRDVRAA